MVCCSAANSYLIPLQLGSGVIRQQASRRVSSLRVPTFLSWTRGFKAGRAPLIVRTGPYAHSAYLPDFGSRATVSPFRYAR